MELVRPLARGGARSPARRVWLVALIALTLAGCGGWRGPDVHLVGDTWVGTERPCDAKDVRCQTIVALALRAVPHEIEDAATRTVLADLPSEYVTDSGEVRRVRLRSGLSTRIALVVDLRDGTRQVIGLLCYLPSYTYDTIAVSMARCNEAPLDEWRNGNVPPSIPSEANFG